MGSFTLKTLEQDPQTSTGVDILKSVAQGLRGAAEGTIGMPQDMINLALQGGNWLTGENIPLSAADIPGFPSSDDVNQFTSKFVSNYEPQTTAGKYGRTMGEFLPILINPMGGARKIAMELGTSLAGGAASELAGEQLAGGKYEGLARLLAGLGGSATPGAIGAGVKGVRTAGSRAAEAAVEDAAAQHGVKLTSGERTGDVSQQMAEQQMLHGSRGELAQRLLEGRRKENLQAIQESGQRFTDTAAPSRGADPVQSGGLLNQQTRGRAEGLMDTGGQQIQDAINAGVVVDAQRLRGLPDELNASLTGVDPFIPDVSIDANTPIAQKAMGIIDKFTTKFNDPNVIDDSLSSVERLRRTLGQLKPTTPEDIRAVTKLMHSFDDWYDNVIHNDAAVVPGAKAAPTTKTPDDILADLKSGRATFREGADIARPRGQPSGGEQVARIASESALPEETQRLLRPNDAGNLSVTAIRTIDRLVEVGAKAEDLDQVRHIVLDQLQTGDPGKVATRVTNFIEKNPTAAAKLFTPEQLRSMKDWAETNKRLVPDPKATNPSKSSYGIVGETVKQGAKAAGANLDLVGAVLGGWKGVVASRTLSGIGAGIKAANEGAAAKKALAGADRRSPSQFALGGGTSAAARATKGAVQGGQTVTVNDPAFVSQGQAVPAGEYNGQQGKIIDMKGGMYLVRMPDGNVVQIGKDLLEFGAP